MGPYRANRVSTLSVDNVHRLSEKTFDLEGIKKAGINSELKYYYSFSNGSFVVV